MKKESLKYLNLAKISNATVLIDPLTKNFQYYHNTFLKMKQGERLKAYAEILLERTSSLLRVAIFIYKDWIA